MKTQIITLESHDDLVSVRDRMTWAKSRRILLVWPGFEKVALRPVDLRILQQHARTLGAEVGLVTRRGDVRREADGFGIPVFRSTAEAQKQAWPDFPAPTRRRRLEGQRGADRLRRFRDQVKPRMGRASTSVFIRVGSFVVGVLAVLVLAALFVPRATITLTPVSKEQDITLPVKASTDVTQVAISGSVPATLRTLEVSGTESVAVTTMAAVPQDTATGIAEFKNLTQSELAIPAGTVVYSITPVSQRFATQNSAQLPGQVNATVQVAIRALGGGAKGNVPANAILAVEGGLATSVSVTNPDPTDGGSDRTTTVPSADDRARLRQALMAQLGAQALDKLQSTIAAKDVLLPNTLQAGKVRDETYDPSAGDPGSLLKLDMTVEFQAQYVKAEDLTSLANGALTAAAPAGFVPSLGSLMFSLASTPQADASGTSQFDLQVRSKLVHMIDLNRAAALVRGYPPSMATAMLQSTLQLARPPQVELSPSWWPWLPLIPFRINVIST